MDFLLPSEFIIQDFHIPTLSIFLGFGLLIWLFVIWYEGRRDGFDEERLLDMSFISLILGSIVFISLYRYLDWLTIYKPYNFLLSFDRWLLLVFFTFFSVLIPTLYLCKHWSWSKYRILDIYVSAIAQFGFVISLGTYLIYKVIFVLPLIILLPLIYMLILRLRGLQFISGFMFSIFLLLMVPYIVLFYRAEGYLLFCILITAASIINFYLRWRKNYAGTTSFGRVYKTVKRKTSREGKRTKRSNKSTKK